jgi:hypothetical protein
VSPSLVPIAAEEIGDRALGLEELILAAISSHSILAAYSDIPADFC